jgi:SAM-dependent methyltransferase
LREFNDPAFRGNKALPVHRWVPWIAGFSSEFAGDALARCAGAAATVLDPFCGVGTTLVEALVRGHRAVGFEINPYAALAARTKAHAHELDPAGLEREILRFQEFYASCLASGSSPKSRPPAGFRTRAPFYSTRVLRKVLIVRDFLARLEAASSDLRDVFRIAFGATLVSYSNYSYEPSLGRRASAGREGIRDFPVGEAVRDKLGEIAHDLRWLRGALPTGSVAPTVVGGSFFEEEQCIPAASVDLILTSPPYLNNYHYNRNTRPHLYWLGFVDRPRDMKSLEEGNFGKYWQTVREKDRVDLEFELPGADLEDRIARLRSLNPERGIYGGRGWANYAASYFNDCMRFARSMQRVLRRGGSALVVIGNSILQGVEMRTDRYLACIAEAAGLEVPAIHVPRSSRVGSSIIHSDVRVAKATGTHQLYEAVVEIALPGEPSWCKRERRGVGCQEEDVAWHATSVSR